MPVEVEVEVETEAEASSSYAAADLKFREALAALRQGNQKEALTLLGETCTKLKNKPDIAALVHTVQSRLCVRIASATTYHGAKYVLSKHATEYAKKAASLAPNSIRMAVNYAQLLYDGVKYPEQYEAVVAECERGLKIENPIDQGEENEFLRDELRTLVQKANIGMIFRWPSNYFA